MTPPVVSYFSVEVVLDTAALISAIRSSTGAAAEIVRLATIGKLALLMDYKLACEYREVALRPHHIAASGRSPREIEAVIESLKLLRFRCW
ncbi:MAG: PIN domain-containing protein [Terracidiphilus sp.]